jgi:hypothetical protein
MFVRRLRPSFLDGYLTSAIARDGSFVPRDREAIDAWIDFFEFEKALYEVEYEVNSARLGAHPTARDSTHLAGEGLTRHMIRPFVRQGDPAGDQS